MVFIRILYILVLLNDTNRSHYSQSEHWDVYKEFFEGIHKKNNERKKSKKKKQRKKYKSLNWV